MWWAYAHGVRGVVNARAWCAWCGARVRMVCVVWWAHAHGVRGVVYARAWCAWCGMRARGVRGCMWVPCVCGVCRRGMALLQQRCVWCGSHGARAWCAAAAAHLATEPVVQHRERMSPLLVGWKLVHPPGARLAPGLKQFSVAGGCKIQPRAADYGGLWCWGSGAWCAHGEAAWYAGPVACAVPRRRWLGVPVACVRGLVAALPWVSACAVVRGGHAGGCGACRALRGVVGCGVPPPWWAWLRCVVCIGGGCDLGEPGGLRGGVCLTVRRCLPITSAIVTAACAGVALAWAGVAAGGCGAAGSVMNPPAAVSSTTAVS